MGKKDNDAITISPLFLSTIRAYKSKKKAKTSETNGTATPFKY